jgi:RNA-directed DNA polymerase
MTSFLAERGLTVRATKSRTVHRDEGFDFLGFNIRRYGGKLLIKPQKEKVQRHLSRIREVLKRNKQATQEHIIQLLNPIITG